MNKYITRFTLAVTAIIILIVSATTIKLWAGPDAAEIAGLSDDRVNARFERAFRHDPAPKHAIRGESIEHDVLRQTMNEINWSRDGLTRSVPGRTLSSESDTSDQKEN